MPKIVATTVAENRTLREATLLQVATHIALHDGLDKVTFSSVAKRAGVSRTSLYAYFNSSADLIADVLIDELSEMNEALMVRVTQARTAREAIQSWIQTSLEYVDNGRHEFMKSIASIDLPPARRAQMQQLHRNMALPLIQVLTACNVPQPDIIAMQISGVVDVSVRRLAYGGNLANEIAAVERFVITGIASYLA